MRLLLILGTFTLFFYPLNLEAQTASVSGIWEGVLTQDNGGYREEYEFELFFRQDGHQLTGRSYVATDKIFAELDIIGEIREDGTVTFRETQLVNYRKLPGMEWCIKKGRLQLSKDGKSLKLIGRWEGAAPNGACVPGNIILEKGKPRA